MSIPVPLEERRFAAGGPNPELPYDECFACFAEQGGLLFRLVTYRAEKDLVPASIQDLANVSFAATSNAPGAGHLTPVWSFYNDTTTTIMRVRCTFRTGTNVQVLGRTRLEACTPEELAEGKGDNLPMAATLDVPPGATALYVAVKSLTGFHLSYVTEAAPAMSVEFLTGTPTVRYDKIYKCFKDNGNGLLFRLVDEARHTWSFYNDTREYIMKVEFVLQDTSHAEVRPMGHATVTACPSAGDDATLFTLFVEPGATQPLLQGTPTLYQLSFSAEPVGAATAVGRPVQTPVNVTDGHSNDSHSPLSIRGVPVGPPLHPSGPVPTVKELEQYQQHQYQQQQQQQQLPQQVYTQQQMQPPQQQQIQQPAYPQSQQQQIQQPLQQMYAQPSMQPSQLLQSMQQPAPSQPSPAHTVEESAIFDQRSYQAGSVSSQGGASADVARELQPFSPVLRTDTFTPSMHGPDAPGASEATTVVYTDPQAGLLQPSSGAAAGGEVAAAAAVMPSRSAGGGLLSPTDAPVTAAATAPVVSFNAPSPPSVAAPASATAPALAPPLPFLNGRPDPEIIPAYDRIFECFEGHKNGLLFRLVDDVNHIWAFYNDTTEYTMEAHVRLKESADLLIAPGVHVSPDVTSHDGTGVIASVFVPPLATAPFLVGEPLDFELATSALPCGDVREEVHEAARQYLAGERDVQSQGVVSGGGGGVDAAQSSHVEPGHPVISAPTLEEMPMDGTPHSPMSAGTPVTMRGGRTAGNNNNNVVVGGGGGGSSTMTGDDDRGSWRNADESPHGTDDAYMRMRTPSSPPQPPAALAIPLASPPYPTAQKDDRSHHEIHVTHIDTPHHDHGHDTADVTVPSAANGWSASDLSGPEHHPHDDEGHEGTLDEDATSASNMRTPMVSVYYDNGSPAPFLPGTSSAEPDSVVQHTPLTPGPPAPLPAEGAAGGDSVVSIEARSSERDTAESLPFVHGHPDPAVMPVWDAYFKCFKEHGNGLLFRLVDTHTNTWAFYNDTLDNWMEVHVLFEPEPTEPRVVLLGDAHPLDDADLGQVCAVEVPPLQTVLFCQSPSRVFTTKFMAMPVRPRGEASAEPPRPPRPSVSPAEASFAATPAEVSEGETINLDVPSITPRSEEARAEVLSDSRGVGSSCGGASGDGGDGGEGGDGGISS